MDITALYDLSYGMYIVGANENERLCGCIANTLIQVTNENPTIAISLNKDNYTYEVIKKTGRFSVSILSEDTNPKVIGTFGFQSSIDTLKYEDYNYELSSDLPILKENCTSALICDVVSMTDAGTHVVILARLKDAFKISNLTPMTYSYYHNTIKGTASKNAPTYREEVKQESPISYVCGICGYIYEGDITKEPDNYACPICGVSKDNFVLN